MPLMYFGLALTIVGVLAWLINTSNTPAPALPDSIKTILNVVLSLIVVGMVLWLINTYVPMAGSIKAILNLVVVAATCVRVLQALGLWDATVRLWNNLWNRRTENDTVGARMVNGAANVK